MRIAFFDTKPYDVPHFEKYGNANGLEFRFYDAKLNRHTAGLASDCDAVCAFVNDDISKECIDALVKLGVKAVAMRCAGYNNVDVKYAFGKLHILHVPAYSPHAVAEHTAAMLLTSIRRIHKAYDRTRDFNFSLRGLTGFELYGKTVGIVGTGRIGRVFAEICCGFGMKVLGFDKFPAEDAPVEYVTLERLFSESDIISFHCPLTEETRHIVNSETVEKMKRGVVIVNTSRGGLIDAEALLEGIKSRHIGAACLDVYEEESDVFFEDCSGHIMDDDVLARLISMPNVLVTSHQAFLTDEALDSIAETTVQNIVVFFETGACENELCYRCGSIESCKANRAGKCF